MSIANFFKDNSGKIKLVYWPNWPIWLILVVSLIGNIASQLRQITDLIISGALIYWGYLEVSQGANGFRRTLGVFAIGYAIWRLVQ